MNATPASSGPNLGLILALTVNGPGDEFFRSEKEMRNVRYQGHRPDTAGAVPDVHRLLLEGHVPGFHHAACDIWAVGRGRRVRVQQRLGPFWLPSVITQQFLNRFFDPVRLGSKDLPRC